MLESTLLEKEYHQRELNLSRSIPDLKNIMNDISNTMLKNN